MKSLLSSEYVILYLKIKSTFPMLTSHVSRHELLRRTLLQLPSLLLHRSVCHAQCIIAVTVHHSYALASEHDEGASLSLALRALKEESVAQGKLHADAANDLQTKIADPFAEWAKGYKARCLP